MQGQSTLAVKVGQSGCIVKGLTGAEVLGNAPSGTPQSGEPIGLGPVTELHRMGDTATVAAAETRPYSEFGGHVFHDRCAIRGIVLEHRTPAIMLAGTASAGAIAMQ